MVLALAALVAGLAGLLAVVRKIAAALLAAFMACLGGALAVLREVAAALLPALVACLSGAFPICREIARAASMFSHSCPPLLLRWCPANRMKADAVPKLL
jgi:hypothetical protein